MSRFASQNIWFPEPIGLCYYVEVVGIETTACVGLFDYFPPERQGGPVFARIRSVALRHFELRCGHMLTVNYDEGPSITEGDYVPCLVCGPDPVRSRHALAPGQRRSF